MDGIFPSNRPLPSQSPDKSGVIGKFCRIIRHLGSGNQIDTAMIFARADFVKVRRTLRVAGACEFKYLVAWSG